MRTLAYEQAFGGTVVQNISGAGTVTVSGLDIGQTLAFTGGASLDGGFIVSDASSISLAGSYSASVIGVALNSNGATVSVLDGSSLTGGDFGIYSDYVGQTINNLGMINATNYVGVRIAGGTINNGSSSDSDATISGYYTGSSNWGDVVVNNYGTIHGTLYNGLDTAGSLTLVNYADGVLEGQGLGGSGNGVGVLVGGDLSGTNDGIILGRFAGLKSNGALNFTNSGLIGSGSVDGMGTFAYSDGNDGIQALGGGTLMNLAGGEILGSISGIYLANTSLTVVNDGTVHGNQYGIYADAAVDLINNASGVVDGGTTGIQLNRDGNIVDNGGSITGATAIYGGSLTLDNAGYIKGTNSGIVLTSGQASTLTNELGGTIQGGSQAIQNAGAGTVTAINGGDIVGGFVSTAGGNLDINNQSSGNIVRVAFGSAIDLSNGGILTLTNAGDIVGSGWGVVGRNSGDSIVNSGRIASGTISGDTITVSGANAIELQQGGTVTNLDGGQISGNGYGVFSYGTLNLDNRSGASITANNAGVYLLGGPATVLNDGTITGGNHGVIYSGNGGLFSLTNNGTMIGTVYNAVYAGSGTGNTVTNNAMGVMIGGNAAVYADGADFTLNNAGLIQVTGGPLTSALSGVYVTGANATVNNSGLIDGRITSGRGVTFIAGGTVNNLAGGQILATANAVAISGGAGTVTNAGTIAGGTNGIFISAAGTVSNQSTGVISGNQYGVYVSGAGSTVTNAGSISGGGSQFDSGIRLDGANSTMTNQAVGLVTGARAVVFTGTGAIFQNAGTVRSNATIDAQGYGVMLFAGGAVTNVSGGLIVGQYRGVAIQGGVGAVTNAGSITADLDNAISLFNGGTVDNQVGGTLTALGAGGWGIYATGGAIDITNAGLINADTGIVTNANGALVRNSGTIHGTVGGVTSLGSTTQLLTNSGLIAGASGSGVVAGGAVVLDNQSGGTIRGGNSGVYLNAGGTITNSGTIESLGTAGFNQDGISAFGALDLTNSGAITAAVNAGVVAYDSVLTVDNQIGGTITGGSNAFGVAINAQAGLNLINGGTLNAGSGTTTAVLVAGTSVIDLLAGSTTNGNVVSTGSSTSNLTVAGMLNGGYDATAGTAVDTVTLASTGSMNSAALGDGDDAFTTFGGAIGGNVVGGLGNDNLVFDVAGSVTYAGDFTGFETGTKIGTGLVNLTGNNVVTAFAVNGGTLAINGSLASNVTVNSGGKLGGIGTITGSLTIGAGGILAPGNSIGTMNVVGNLTFASGSTYQVEISPTASDRTNASGNIAINGGSVTVLGGAGVYAPLTTYTILSAGGSVTGTFASVTDNLAFLDPTLVYTTNQVLLEMRRNNIDFADAAVTSNQVAVANAIQTLPAGDLYDAVLVQSVAGAQQAYDALSGEIYASTQAVLAQQGDRLRVALLDADATGADGLALWADAKAGHSNLDATNAGSAPIVSDHRDMIVGAKWQGAGFSAVAGGGISRSEVDVARRDSSADIDSWMIGGQLGYRFSNLRVTGGFTYASHQVDTDRAVVFPGFVDATSGSQDATTRTIYGEIAYRLGEGAVAVEPFLGVANQHVRIDAMVEQGGDAALVIGSGSLNSTMTEVGVRVSGSAKLGAGSIYPIGTVAWQHLLGDRRGSMDAAFDIGSDPFTIDGAKRSRDGLRVNAGLGYRIGGASIGVSYDGRLSNSDTDHGVRLTAGIQF